MVDFLRVIPNRVFVYIYFNTTACAHQPCFTGLVCIRRLQYETHAKGLIHCDACCSLRHDHSTGINDVMDELVPCLVLKEACRDHSDGLCVNLFN